MTKLNEELWIFFGVHTANAVRVAQKMALDKQAAWEEHTVRLKSLKDEKLCPFNRFLQLKSIEKQIQQYYKTKIW